MLEEIQPATVRQLYYQLVSRGVIEKTEAAYKGLVHNLTVMRRAREIPFDWLADNTRWMRKPRTYSSLTGMLESQQEFYRRALCPGFGNWSDCDRIISAAAFASSTSFFDERNVRASSRLDGG